MVYLLAFAVFALAVLGMAVGVIFAGKRLRGSCGGTGPDGQPLGDCLCERTEQDACREKQTAGEPLEV